MSGGKLIDRQKIVGWSDNHKNNRTLSFGTDSASISLSELEDFLKSAKANCPDFTGLRIYFVRYDLSADKTNIKTAGSNLSQPSVVLVPIKSFDAAKGVAGEDYRVGTTDQVFALAFTDPDGSSEPGDTSILCPPRC